MISGYNVDELCFECSNEGQTIVSPKIKVTQTSKCQTQQLLSVKEDAVTQNSLAYSSTVPSEIISAGWENFFVNSDHVNCPISSCILKTGPNC